MAIVAYLALVPSLGWRGAVLGTYISETAGIVAGWLMLVRYQRIADRREHVDAVAASCLTSPLASHGHRSSGKRRRMTWQQMAQRARCTWREDVPVMIPFVDLKAAVPGDQAGDRRGRAERLRRSTVRARPAVETFEAEFATHCGARHAMGVNSGTVPFTWRCSPPASGRATR